MQSEIIEAHWCVSPTTGEGRLVKYHQHFCSNHLPNDHRVFGMALPEHEFENAKQRLEKDQNK